MSPDVRRRGRAKLLERLLLQGMVSGKAQEVTHAYRAALRADAEAIIAGKRGRKTQHVDGDTTAGP
jgi:hypothetical protein